MYSEHISIEFSFGAELSDSDKILEGAGKKRRHIKIRQIEDVQKKQVEMFIFSAMNSNKAQ